MNLSDDIIQEICIELPDHVALNLFSTSKELNKFLDNYSYKNNIEENLLNKVKRGRIEGIILTEIKTKIPNEFIVYEYYNPEIDYYKFSGNIKRLIFHKYKGFTSFVPAPIHLELLPSCLTHLEFGNFFDQELVILPKTLTHISFGSRFNQEVNGFLPTGLLHLQFGHAYDRILNTDLLQQLVYLKFGNRFNQPIKLPPKLTYLEFGIDYKQDINELPKRLIQLVHHGLFDLDITNYFPETLRILELDTDFNSPIKGLPKLLTHLILSMRFNQPIDDLPENLEYLQIGHIAQTNRVPYDNCTEPYYLFSSFNQPVNKFPKNLKKLCIGSFNKPIKNLPEGLVRLELGGDFNQSLAELPSTLKYLSLGQSYDLPLNGLPDGLEYLIIDDWNTNIENFNQPLNNLPSSLIELRLGYSFNQPIDINKVSILPEKLKHLCVGYSFTQSLDYLPENLEYLQIGKFFRNVIPSVLSRRFLAPSVLSHKVEGSLYSRFYTGNLDNLPASLKELNLSNMIYEKPLRPNIKIKSYTDELNV